MYLLLYGDRIQLFIRGLCRLAPSVVQCRICKLAYATLPPFFSGNRNLGGASESNSGKHASSGKLQSQLCTCTLVLQRSCFARKWVPLEHLGLKPYLNIKGPVAGSIHGEKELATQETSEGTLMGTCIFHLSRRTLCRLRNSSSVSGWEDYFDREPD